MEQFIFSHSAICETKKWTFPVLFLWNKRSFCHTLVLGPTARRQASSPVSVVQRRRSVCWKMMIRLNEWTQVKKCASAHIVFLWAPNTEPVNICRYTVAAYGAYVMSVQQVRKWCCDFANGRVSVTDKDRSGHPATADAFVSDIGGMVRARSRVSSKQFELACSVSHDIGWTSSVNFLARSRQTVARGPHLHRHLIFSCAPTMYQHFEPIVHIL